MVGAQTVRQGVQLLSEPPAAFPCWGLQTQIPDHGSMGHTLSSIFTAACLKRHACQGAPWFFHELEQGGHELLFAREQILEKVKWDVLQK